MELSNKALAVLLLAALVVSLGGTIISLNRMNSVEMVGFATSSTGIVNLSIASTISITTNESSIVDFGACTLNSSRAINISSWGNLDTAQYCPQYQGTNITNISVRNDGNVVVNVSIATSQCAPGAGNAACTFLNLSTTPWNENGLFEYTTSNYGKTVYTGGCGTVNGTWNAFNSTAAVPACIDLDTDAFANSFVTDFRLRVPNGLGVGQQLATITFTAYQG
jgi:hypothetical protein